MQGKPIPRRTSSAEGTVRKEHRRAASGLCQSCAADYPCAPIRVCDRLAVAEDREAKRYGSDVPARVRSLLLSQGEAATFAEASYHEWRMRFIATNQESIARQGGIDLDVAIMDAFSTAWDEAVDAILALADTEDGAKMIWRKWCEGMLAQGRSVAPERMEWKTLTEQDHELDRTIARGIGEYLHGLLAR